MVDWERIRRDYYDGRNQSYAGIGRGDTAKRAPVDQALSALYGGDLSALAAGWKITAATAADVYAASPTPPAQDVEALRQFFAMNTIGPSIKP